MASTLSIAQAVILVLQIIGICLSKQTIVFVTLDEAKCHHLASECIQFIKLVNNTSRYFNDNTTVAFAPGNYTAPFNKELVIKDKTNLVLKTADLPSENKSTALIYCTGNFGLVFINITNLTISNLHFSYCGASLSEKMEEHVKMHSTMYSCGLFQFPSAKFSALTAIYMVHIIRMNISHLSVVSSRGIGLLGINIFEESVITQSTFEANAVNSILLYGDTLNESTWSPNILNISKTAFRFGNTHTRNNFTSKCIAGGLTMVFWQSTYTVWVTIYNSSAESNTGSHHGNLGFFVSEHSPVLITGSHINVSRGKCADYPNHQYCISGLSVLPLNSTHTRDDKCVSVPLSYFVFELPLNYSYCTYPFTGIIKLELRDCYFAENDGGVEIMSTKSVVLQNSVFYRNNHMVLFVRLSNIFFSGRTYFENNSRIYASTSNLTFWGSVRFSNHNGCHSALHLYTSRITFNGETVFTHNHADAAAVIAALDKSSVELHGVHTLFHNNTSNRASGAIALYRKSSVSFRGWVQFHHNVGVNGGALQVNEESQMVIFPNTLVEFRNNHAQFMGGAIAVDADQECTRPSKCFFAVSGDPGPHNISIVGNIADFAGDALYLGGKYSCNNLDYFFNTVPNNNSVSTVTSPPLRVCICELAKPNCNIIHYSVTAFPGQTFFIPVVAVGQELQATPATVRSQLLKEGNSALPALGHLQDSQHVHKHCKNLSFNLLTQSNSETIVLTVLNSISLHDLHDRDHFKEPVYVNITLLSCPIGFHLFNGSCTCHPKFAKHGLNCSIDTQKIHRRNPLWIGTVSEDTNISGILVHQHCPLDYCKRSNNIDIRLQDLDVQCAFNHAGILCGGCQVNMSTVLGSSKCKHCSSLLPLMLIPLFAVAGILLLVFLTVFNLTVSTGTINGLIFYANIVQANQATFFPHGQNFCSIFIAWLSLDLGIETCLYNGLNAYAKAWLQFVFPLYIWIVEGILVISSHYSVRFSKLFRRNAIQVLATLFLLSYAKLLRIITTAFSFTYLEYPDRIIKVWLYDGNVQYLSGTHVLLFVIALVLLVVISVPYTSVLLSYQHLLPISNHRALRWVHKLKPLLDTYTGPYKDTHRYWTGLLLVVRIILFVIYSANVLGDPAANLVATTIVITLVFLLFVVIRGPYKLQALNILECSFYANLIMLSSVTHYTMSSSNTNTSAPGYTFVGVAFITFCGILLYHTNKRFQICQKLCQIFKATFSFKGRQEGIEENAANQDNPTHNAPNGEDTRRVPCHVLHFNDLREPLLEYYT